MELCVGLCRVPNVFADRFSGIKLPHAINGLEPFSNMAFWEEVMETLTELTGDFYEVESSALS